MNKSINFQITISEDNTIRVLITTTSQSPINCAVNVINQMAPENQLSPDELSDLDYQFNKFIDEFDPIEYAYQVFEDNELSNLQATIEENRNLTTFLSPTTLLRLDRIDEDFKFYYERDRRKDIGIYDKQIF